MIMQPSMSNVIIKHRSSVEYAPSRVFGNEITNIDCNIDLIQEQLDQLEKENSLIMDKASFLLQNLRFGRNKKMAA